MKVNNTLIISNLHVGIDSKEILHGLSLSVKPAQVHAIMGPNGSGKSTLAYALLGHPSYTISDSKSHIQIGDMKKNILDLTPEERAKAGLFLAFQSPIAIPGVSVINLLRTSYQSIHADSPGTKTVNTVQNPVLARRWQSGGMDMITFMKTIKEYAGLLKIDESFLSRGIHDGFSGGEKKKMEMLQALVLAPKFAVFDEIDTGLDVDALKVVGLGIDRLSKNGTGVIVITHYQRILRYIKPDVVHVLVNGKIVDTGTASLAKTIEENGYKKYMKGERSN
jgi:Fe-S cluster assembly ATP-binding protein